MPVVAVHQALAEAHRQRSSLLSDLLDHVFDCPYDFLIGEVDLPDGHADENSEDEHEAGEKLLVWVAQGAGPEFRAARL